MVYTGDTLIYGVQLDLNEAKRYIDKYNDSSETYYSDDLDSYYDYEKIMDDFNLSIKLLHLCTFKTPSFKCVKYILSIYILY